MTIDQREILSPICHTFRVVGEYVKDHMLFSSPLLSYISQLPVSQVAGPNIWVARERCMYQTGIELARTQDWTACSDL